MDRRALLCGLAMGALGGPRAVRAQPAVKTFKIGILSAINPRTMTHFEALVRRLRALGYVEGRNLVIEFKNAEGEPTRLPGLAAELVRETVDLIVAAGTEATLQAALEATRTVPIVITAVDYDPVARGHVGSLAKPGGSVTGVFLNQIELTAKRVQLFKQALPRLTHLAVFWDGFSRDQWNEAERTGRRLGLRLDGTEFRNPPYEYGDAVRTAARKAADALLLPMSPIFFRQRVPLVQAALKSRLPIAAGAAQFVDAGALMTYGANLDDMFGQVGPYIDKILRGAKPADLPVEQPTKFELVINLKTAKALGLTIPPSLLLRADQVG